MFLLIPTVKENQGMFQQVTKQVMIYSFLFYVDIIRKHLSPGIEFMGDGGT